MTSTRLTNQEAVLSWKNKIVIPHAFRLSDEALTRLRGACNRVMERNTNIMTNWAQEPISKP